MKLLFFSIMFLGLCHCSTGPKTDLRKVSLSHSKGDVLHILGNPHRTYVKEGVLRWVYLVPEHGDLKVEKEVWFKEGLVVFVDSPGIKSKASPDAKIQFTPVE